VDGGIIYESTYVNYADTDINHVGDYVNYALVLVIYEDIGINYVNVVVIYAGVGVNYPVIGGKSPIFEVFSPFFGVLESGDVFKTLDNHLMFAADRLWFHVFDNNFAAALVINQGVGVPFELFLCWRSAFGLFTAEKGFQIIVNRFRAVNAPLRGLARGGVILEGVCVIRVRRLYDDVAQQFVDLFVDVAQDAHPGEVFMGFAEPFRGEVIREELGAFPDVSRRAQDEALFFDAHAVEPFALKRAQAHGVLLQLAFDFVEQAGDRVNCFRRNIAVS